MSFKGIRGCNSRVSKEDQEFYDLRQRAAEYYRANSVPQNIEGVLNQMFLEKPDDIYGYLANYFSQHSAKAVICRTEGKEVYDGNGQISAQADVYCIIRNEEKWVSSGAVPSHGELASGRTDPSGVAEESSAQSHALETALSWINQPISTMLRGLNPSDQTTIDKILSDFFLARFLENEDEKRKESEAEEQKSAESTPEPAPPPPPQPPTKDRKGADKALLRKKSVCMEQCLPPADPPVPVLPGCNAVGAVSLAIAKATARLQRTPLYQHIRLLRRDQTAGDIHIPFPMVTVLSCGRMSPGKLHLLEEVIVLPAAGQRVREKIAMVLDLQKEVKRILNSTSKTGTLVFPVTDGGALLVGFDRVEQPLDVLMEACANLQLTPGTDVHFALSCAAHTLLDYSKGKYEIVAGTLKAPGELIEVYESLISRYPGICALIDPFRKEDLEQWDKLSCALIGQPCCLIADAAFCSPPRLYGDKRLLPPGVAGVILKHVNETTITDLLCATSEGRDSTTILEQSGTEWCDDYFVDLAVGLGVKFVKLGGLMGGVRLARYNRLMMLEEELTRQGILGKLTRQGILGSNQLELPLFGTSVSPGSELPETE
ncbi:enolase 4 isoform X1 [Alosa sapidissima]|uniref:enolase 4 isoform X1 n=1 Tax=Alosa sapidissima TaxID=34773 RepID=UPI001C0A54AE|nr:enolase 4 isoform X1 [Alosa sapidissima]XP_041921407.1 enolase 4 isoform X1 [Alosa sapidissima]